MSDEDKRGTRKFEPPPWEVEAFEALAKKRAEEQAALDALAAAREAAPDPGVPVAEEIAAGVLAAKAAESPEAGTPQADTTVAADTETVPAQDAKAAELKVDERQVQAMLMELGREETTETGHIKLIARVAAITTAAVGLGMLFGGVLAIQRAGGTTAGVMGSGALSVFGLCFVAMSVWVWVGSNRVKGSR